MNNSNPPNNPNENTHPDMRCNAPGRIPESLINAAIDGELNEDIQREIAHALKYDPIRKQELLDTTDAINALQMPIATPDFTDVILVRADRNRRFIPASWRNHVRAGRLGIAAALLLALMSVAGLQRIYPRLTTIAAHSTPVHNIEQAMEQDADQLASCLKSEAQTLYGSLVSPLASIVSAPGRNDYNFDIAVESSAPSNTFAAGYFAKIHLMQMGQGQHTVYIMSTRRTSSAPSPSPVRLFATSNMGSWVYNTRSVSYSNTQIESIELDVPALP